MELIVDTYTYQCCWVALESVVLGSLVYSSPWWMPQFCLCTAELALQIIWLSSFCCWFGDIGDILSPTYSSVCSRNTLDKDNKDNRLNGSVISQAKVCICFCCCFPFDIKWRVCGVWTDGWMNEVMWRCYLRRVMSISPNNLAFDR